MRYECINPFARGMDNAKIAHMVTQYVCKQVGGINLRPKPKSHRISAFNPSKRIVE